MNKNLEQILQVIQFTKDNALKILVMGTTFTTMYVFGSAILGEGIRHANAQEAGKKRPAKVYTLPNKQSAEALMKAVKWDEVREWYCQSKENADKLYTAFKKMGITLCRNQLDELMDGKYGNGEIKSFAAKIINDKSGIATLVKWYSGMPAEVKIENGAATAYGEEWKSYSLTNNEVRAFYKDFLEGIILPIYNNKYKKAAPTPTRVRPTPFDTGAPTQKENTTQTPTATPKTETSTGTKSPAETRTPAETLSPTQTPTQKTPETIQTPPHTPPHTPLYTSSAETKTPETPNETQTPKDTQPDSQTNLEKKITSYAPEARLIIGDPRKNSYAQPILGDEINLIADKKGNLQTYLCLIAIDTADDKNRATLLISDPANNYSKREWSQEFQIQYTAKELETLLRETTKGKSGYQELKDQLFLKGTENSENEIIRINVYELNEKLPEQETRYRRFLGWSVRKEKTPITVKIGYSVDDLKGNTSRNYDQNTGSGFAKINICPQKEVYAAADPANLLLQLFGILFLGNKIDALHVGAGLGGGAVTAGGGIIGPGPGTGP